MKKEAVECLPDTYWAQVGQTDGHRWYVCGEGLVICTDKKWQMYRVPVHLNRYGIAVVTIAGRACALHTLVAREFMLYRTGTHIRHADGNPYNCAVKNLIIKEIKRKK